MSLVEQLIELRDFLVPENGPDRLVKVWLHSAEDSSGMPVTPTSSSAIRFCVWGGAAKLTDYGYSYYELKNFLNKTNNDGKWKKFYFSSNNFWFASPHSAKEVRSFLDAAIAYAKETK